MLVGLALRAFLTIAAPTGTSVCAEQARNLIENPGFETPDPADPTLPAGWERWSAGRQHFYRDPQNPRTGTASLACTAIARGWRHLRQWFPDYEPDSLYRISFCFKTNGAPCIFPAGIRVFDTTPPQSKRSSLFVKTMSVEDTEWTEHEGEFITPSEPGRKICIMLSVRSGGRVKGWFDDLRLVRVCGKEVRGLSDKLLDLKVELLVRFDGLVFDIEDTKKASPAANAASEHVARSKAEFGDKADGLRSRLLAGEVEVASAEKAIERLRLEGQAEIEKLTEKVAALPDREREAEEAPGHPDEEGLRLTVARSKNEDPQERAAAAKELGRIGARKAIPDLVRLIVDEHQEVRVNAITSLAWMRAKEAVPALLEASDSPDRWVRRRATQALGQIGDRQAVPKLIGLLGDADPAVKKNAVLALGWLRERTAAAPLLQLYKAELAKPQPKEQWPFVTSAPVYFCSAIAQSLGHIGDRAVTPFLLGELDKEHFPLPWHNKVLKQNAVFALGLLGDERAVPKLSALAAQHDRHWIIQNEAKDALWRIEQSQKGEEPSAGITQLASLSRRKDFYHVADSFPVAYGRYFNYRRYSRPSDPFLMLKYAKRGGGTDFVVSGWEALAGEGKEKVIAGMDGAGFRLFSVARGSTRIKVDAARAAFTYRNHPCYAGVKGEESLVTVLEPVSESEFREYLGKKYNADELKGMGIDDLKSLSCPFRFYPGYYPHVGRTREKDPAKVPLDPELRFRERVLWAEFMEYVEANMLEHEKEAAQWLRTLRKNAATLFYFSTSNFSSGQTMTLYPKFGEVVDLVGIEPSYSTRSYSNAFYADLARDGEIRPVGMMVYAFGSPIPRHYETGISISILHAQQFYVWGWLTMFEHRPPSVARHFKWKPGRWDAASRAFAKIRKIEPYLVKTGSASPVALVFSGRTNALLYRVDSLDAQGHSKGGHYTRYLQNQLGIYVALTQSHIQSDLIWAETLSKEKLKNYKVLILSDAKTITPRQTALIREWVKQGGSLICTGTTTAYDQWGREVPDYAFADVFGVKYGGSEGGVPLAEVDKELRLYTEPPKDVGEMAITRESSLLRKMKQGEAVTYDIRTCGYDRVEPTTGRVVAQWAAGEPAVITNSYGKGKSLFMTATYPGLSYTARGFQYHFWSGARELLARAVEGALRATGEELPFAVADCPESVEIVVRTQSEKRRWVLHLLNYDDKSPAVTGVRVRVRPPSTRKVELFYPNDEQAVDFTQQGDTIAFGVRDFEVHEVVVIQY